MPVGSFPGSLDDLAWGLDRDGIVDRLGRPNRICTHPGVDHLAIRDPALAKRVAAATAERWIYVRRPPASPVPRDPDPDCRAPGTATELGLDAAGRLRWIVREMLQTRPEIDPGLAGPVTERR